MLLKGITKREFVPLKHSFRALPSNIMESIPSKHVKPKTFQMCDKMLLMKKYSEAFTSQRGSCYDSSAATGLGVGRSVETMDQAS